ncbi:MAG: AsmA family protein, partial [Desulfobacterales bacterium]|nr:AsmA family protein [Desulfobacterales bacterium]
MKWKIPLFLAVFLFVGLAALYAYILAYDFNSLKPEIISAVKRSTGRELAIKGKIKVAIGLSPSLVIDRVSLENAKWGSRPRMLQVKRFEMQLALLPLITGTLEVRKASLIDSEFFLEVNNKGILNLPDPGAKSPPAESVDTDSRSFLPQIDLKNVRIINSRLIFKGRLATKPMTLYLKQARLTSSAPGSKTRLDITATYNEQPLVAKGVVGPFDSLLDPEKPWPLELAVNAIGSKLKLAGTVKNVLLGSGMALDFKFASGDVSRSAGIAGIHLPFKTGATIAGHLSGSLENSLKLSRLKFNAGRNRLQGSVLAKMEGSIPYLKASLTSERLDLRPADPSKPAVGKQAPGPPDRKFFSSSPFPTGLLKKVSADVALRFKQCFFARSAVQDLKLNFSLKNGRLVLKPVTAVIGSGKLQASASLREMKKKM